MVTPIRVLAQMIVSKKRCGEEMKNAIKVTVSTFGALAGLAVIEHVSNRR